MTATTTQAPRTANRWANIISLWVGLILLVVEALIATRFILLLAGATAGNSFVDLIYDLSGPLVQPFDGIFDDQTVGDDGIFEPASLIALIVYPLLALLLGAIIRTVVASAPQPKANVWGTTARDVYVRLSTLNNSLSAAAAVPRGPDSPPQIVDSADAQIDEISTTLHTLELDPPNERAAVAVRDLLLSLNAVRAALRAESAQPRAATPAAPGGASPATTRIALREQLAALDASLQSFRAAI